jgi:hypothetical protein
MLKPGQNGHPGFFIGACDMTNFDELLNSFQSQENGSSQGNTFFDAQPQQ